MQANTTKNTGEPSNLQVFNQYFIPGRKSDYKPEAKNLIILKGGGIHYAN